MRITKFEALLLSQALHEYKFSVFDKCNSSSKLKLIVESLSKLQSNLLEYSNDNRSGRTSDLTFNDKLKRYIKNRKISFNKT